MRYNVISDRDYHVLKAMFKTKASNTGAINKLLGDILDNCTRLEPDAQHHQLRFPKERPDICWRTGRGD